MRDVSGHETGAWDYADRKAAADVALMSSLASQPDRVSWRLSEDAALRRALIWNASRERKYPPPGGLIPLAYELSDDALREVIAKQRQVDGEEWSWFDLAETQLLYCRQKPFVCLIYDQALLEDSLDLQDGDLTLATGPNVAVVATGLLGITLLASAAAFRRAQSGNGGMNRSSASTRLQIIPERHVARRGTLEVPLTPRDLKLLCILEKRGGCCRDQR